jgi:hypothetical protein
MSVPNLFLFGLIALSATTMLFFDTLKAPQFFWYLHRRPFPLSPLPFWPTFVVVYAVFVAIWALIISSPSFPDGMSF